MKLLERNIASVGRRLVLLAPSRASVSTFFRNVAWGSNRHRELVHEMQRLRGTIYLDDGAVDRQQLSSDGLHQTPEDEKSWHLLMLNKQGRVNACAWYLEHDPAVSVDRLRVGHTVVARQAATRPLLWKAVESELARARREGLRFAEVGGWAVSRESRCTCEGLMLALVGYSLGRIRGGCLGITTATVRHCSSSILRRLGGTELEADGVTVPRYYDPRYRCDMEILRFDSRNPNAKYVHLIETLREKLAHVFVAVKPNLAVPVFNRSVGSIQAKVPA